jgi:hypothetical protein
VKAWSFQIGLSMMLQNEKIAHVVYSTRRALLPTQLRQFETIGIATPISSSHKQHTYHELITHILDFTSVSREV